MRHDGSNSGSMKCRVANKIRNAAAAANDTLAAKTEPAAIGLVVAIF
jgi:hypothetical protein